MGESISEYIESITKAGAYFSIAGIDQIRELQIRIRKIFSKSLGIDAIALYTKREKENGEITSHEQRGFYQILDDYSSVIESLKYIIRKNLLLKIAKPIVIMLGILILTLVVLTVTGRIDKIYLLTPVLERPRLLSKFFYLTLIALIFGLIFSVYCKTRGDIYLDKINLILMEYDPSDEMSLAKINTNLSQKENEEIEKLKKELTTP